MLRLAFITTGILLISSNAYANNYVLTESVNNSGLFFESVNTEINEDIQQFSLHVDESGKYIFTPKDNNNNDLGVDNLYSLGTENSFDSAIKKCNNLHINGKEWNLLTQENIEKLTGLENNIDSNILNFFDAASNLSNKFWISSDQNWNNDYKINIMALDHESLSNGHINAGFLSLPDGIPANIVCVEQ